MRQLVRQPRLGELDATRPWSKKDLMVFSLDFYDSCPYGVTLKTPILQLPVEVIPNRRPSEACLGPTCLGQHPSSLMSTLDSSIPGQTSSGSYFVGRGGLEISSDPSRTPTLPPRRPLGHSHHAHVPRASHGSPPTAPRSRDRARRPEVKLDAVLGVTRWKWVPPVEGRSWNVTPLRCPAKRAPGARASFVKRSCLGCLVRSDLPCGGTTGAL